MLTPEVMKVNQNDSLLGQTFKRLILLVSRLFIEQLSHILEKHIVSKLLKQLNHIISPSEPLLLSNKMILSTSSPTGPNSDPDQYAVWSP